MNLNTVVYKPKCVITEATFLGFYRKEAIKPKICTHKGCGAISNYSTNYKPSKVDCKSAKWIELTKEDLINPEQECKYGAISCNVVTHQCDFNKNVAVFVLNMEDRTVEDGMWVLKNVGSWRKRKEVIGMFKPEFPAINIANRNDIIDKVFDILAGEAKPPA